MSEPGSSKWRSFLLPKPRFLIARIAVFVGILPLVGWLGGGFWFFDLFNHFQVQYAVVLFVCIVILCLLRAFCFAGVAAVLAVVPVVRMLPERGVEIGGSGDSIRVTTFNVLSSNSRYQEASEWIEKSEADIVFLPEITQAWTKGLLPLLDSYPYVINHYEGGTSVWRFIQSFR